MENKKWTRRQVIGSMAILPLAANTSLFPGSGLFQVNSKVTSCKLLNSNGAPFEVNKMGRFHICDLLLRPFQIDPEFAPGEIRFVPATTPFRISLPVEVPGFGEVFVYADNRGKGYTAKSLEKTDPLFLNYEFAADRIATAHKIIDECRSAGLIVSPEALKRLSEAERFLAKSEEVKADDKAIAKLAMESLRESLWAGEMIIIERAKQLIERRGTRPSFMFGCNAFRFREYGSQYTKYFESLFNFATLPFTWAVWKR